MIIKEIIKNLKIRKAIYEIDGDLIIISLGTYDGYIQVESETEFQIWASRESENEDLLSEYIEIKDVHELDSIIEELLDSVKELNKNVTKARGILEALETIACENNIPSDLIYSLFNELNFVE